MGGALTAAPSNRIREEGAGRLGAGNTGGAHLDGRADWRTSSEAFSAGSRGRSGPPAAAESFVSPYGTEDPLLSTYYSNAGVGSGQGDGGGVSGVVAQGAGVGPVVLSLESLITSQDSEAQQSRSNSSNVFHW